MKYEDLKIGELYYMGNWTYQFGVKNNESGKVDLICSREHIPADPTVFDFKKKHVLNFNDIKSHVSNGWHDFRDYMDPGFEPDGIANISSLRSLDQDLVDMKFSEERLLLDGNFKDDKKFRLILPKGFSEIYSLK